jgi:hypothetical protein
MKKIELNRFVLNYTIMTTVICLIVADLYITYSNKLINFILLPLLQIDIDNNGKPDIKELKMYNITLFNKIKIPFGLILYDLIVLVLKVILLATVIYYMYNYIYIHNKKHF